MDINFLEIVMNIAFNGGVIIILVCYALAELIKSMKLNTVIENRFIPIICAIVGTLMGLIPNIFKDTEIYFNLIYGFIMGVSSTGIFEIIKGSTKKK